MIYHDMALADTHYQITKNTKKPEQSTAWYRLTLKYLVYLIQCCETALDIEIKLDGMEQHTFTLNEALTQTQAFLNRHRNDKPQDRIPSCQMH